MSLTAKQRLFVAEYAIDRNGSAALVRAHYSKRSSDAAASRLLANPKIKAAVEQKLAEVEKKAGLSAEYVLNTHRTVIEKGLEQGDLTAVNAAAAWIGKHLGMYTEKMEVSLTDNLAEDIKLARQRRDHV